MPPTDDHDNGSQQNLEEGETLVSLDTRTPRTMESRALRHQLDRLRTLQQRNDILSGDKPLSGKRPMDEVPKPHSVKNYYKWLRNVAEGESSSVSSSPPPTARPRSRSLQLDAGDLSIFSQGRNETMRCHSPPESSKVVKTVTRLPLDVLKKDSSSEEDLDKIPSPKCCSHVQQRTNVQKKVQICRNSPLSQKKCGRMNGFVTNSAKQVVKTDSERKVRLERGMVIKPKVGPTSKKVLSPIKRQRSKSLDTDGAKFVEEAQRNTPTPSIDAPVLPSISPVGSDGNVNCSSSENIPFGNDSKKPVSILKKCGSENFTKSSRSSYSARVTFNENHLTIPSGYFSGRRASIAEENSLITENRQNQRVYSGQSSSPPPPDRSPNGAWMAPGILPRRRNSLPPLSVTLSEIEAVGSDDEDDLLYTTTNQKQIHLKFHDEEEKRSENSSIRPGFSLVDSCESDSSDNQDEPVCQNSTTTAQTRSCFSVTSKTSSHLEEVDSDDDIRCDVVHSFTPRPKLKNNVLSSNTGMYCGTLS